MMALRSAFRSLRHENPELDNRLQVIFISEDPFRDTPNVLADYVSFFDPQFIGASGSPAELYRLTTILGIPYEYGYASGGSSLSDTAHRPQGDYVVNHSADFYIFDDRARLVTWVEPPHTTSRIVSLLRSIAKLHGG